MVHGLMDTIPRTKTKTLSFRKLIVFFFHAVYYSNNHLERRLKYITTLKNNNNMPVKFKCNQKLSAIVTNCELDLRLNFALNGGHLGHHLHYFNLVNQTREWLILIVCIIRPLNMGKKSKLKFFFLVS